MEVRILHMYNDIMNLYGEYANITLLQRYLSDNGANVITDTLSLYEEKDISGYDFYYMGSGTEKNQKIVLKDIEKYKETLTKASEENKVMLFTGNAFEILGSKITTADGTEFEGLSIGDFETSEGTKRIVGDCLASAEYSEVYHIGFINKCSVTKGVTTPLFKMKMGFGNEKEGGDEGFVKNNTFGTHLIGPVFVKNLHFLNMTAEKLGCEINTQIQSQDIYKYMDKSHYNSVKQLLERIENEK